MAKDKELGNKVIAAAMIEKLKQKTAAVSKRRPKMAEERRTRIAALKGRKVENVPGQDVDDFFSLTEDIDSREELVAKYYTPNIGKLGVTVDKQLKEEIANHRAEQEADKAELEALFVDYGGRDVVLEAVLRRKELRESISKFLENLKKNPLDDTSPAQMGGLVQGALDKGIIEEGPGPIVWGGKPYIQRVEDDVAVAEFVRIFVSFLNGWKEEADKMAAARRDKAMAFVLYGNKVKELHKDAMSLRMFLDSREQGIHCLLPVYARGRQEDGGEKFVAGNAVLEKDGTANVCRKVTTARLARMLFFYTKSGKLQEQADGYRFEGRNFFQVRSRLLREALEEEVKKPETLEEKNSRIFREVCKEFKARLVDAGNANLFFGLENGEDGLYALRGVFGKKEIPVAYVMERTDTKVKVRWALPGDATEILFGAGGETFEMKDLPHPNRHHPVTLRSILRALYQQIAGTEKLEEIPQHLQPAFALKNGESAESGEEEGVATADQQEEVVPEASE